MSFVTTAFRFLVRGGTAANLVTVNETPLARELVAATDTGRLKLGDGTTPYNDLPYLIPDAAAPSFRYTSDTGSTADSDPGSGLFKWNNATQGSATVLYFDDATADTGTDLSTYFGTLAANASSGFIHLIDSDDSAKWQVWRWTSITDGTGYFKFAVTLQASTGSLSDNRDVRVSFHPMPAGGGGSSPMVYVGRATVAGSAATTLTISGLDLNADDCYILEIALKNATASNANISLYYNSDTTATNYDNARLLVTTGASGARANDGFLFALPASVTTNARITVHNDLDGKPTALCNARENNSGSIQLRVSCHAWRTASNVSGITLSSSVASSIAVGSYVDVYKVLV